MTRQISFGFCFLIFVFALVLPSLADAIWNDKESASPYSTERAYKTGDIINIIILESTTAQNRAGTKTDIKDDLSAKFTHTLQQLAPVIGTNNQAAGQAANKYSGSGQTSRVSNVEARIAAWVTDVLPNGNLMIKGRHKVQVNDEIQEISITGSVRAKDISGANTVFSYQVADAELMVKGTGVVAESESPGWFTRILNWLF
ncbi:MAG: flagellar basal body L-ring protein FlgH [Candidatus Margulisbacteria bacterium]|nr:flagellar basal body L-ring protein FlgH [Candidatus Margulisiibacteriota bacterium]